MNYFQSDYFYNHKQIDNGKNYKIVDEKKQNIIYDYRAKPRLGSNELKNSKSFKFKDKLSINKSENTTKEHILINSNIEYIRNTKSDIFRVNKNNNDFNDKSANKSYLTSRNKNIKAISFKNIQLDKLKIFNPLAENTHRIVSDFSI